MDNNLYLRHHTKRGKSSTTLRAFREKWDFTVKDDAITQYISKITSLMMYFYWVQTDIWEMNIFMNILMAQDIHQMILQNIS